MKISKVDNFLLSVESTDKDLLEAIKNQTDGWKVRGSNLIYLPTRSGPKILEFEKYGITYDSETENIIQSVIFNTNKRIENIQKIRSQYGHDVTFDYDVKGVYKPLEHQKIIFNMIAYNSAAAILADPGTCKTGPYLWAIDKRIQKNQIKKCLVITLSDLKKNVLEEARLQIPHIKCVILDNKAQADKILNKGFKNEKKNIDYDIYLANYESMFSLVDLFDDNYFGMVILDEAHRIGSFRSRQTKAIINKFENIKYKYIVTATLLANNSLSFFMPYRFLGPDCVPYANFYEFRRRTCFSVDPNGFIWKELGGTRNEVKEIINKLAVSFTKEECLDLPELIEERYSCEMEPEQAKIYNDIKTNLITFVDDICSKCNKKDKCNTECDQVLSTKNALTAVTKLRQISDGFYLNTKIIIDDEGKEKPEQNIIEFKSNPKLRLLLDIISNIPSDKKIIIWSSFIHSIDLIAQAVENAGFEQYLKLYQDIDTYETVQKFKEPKYRFLISNPSKGGVGQNIQFSNYQIFFDNNYSFIQRKQAIGRQLREGQNDKVTVIDLSCQGTIDEGILKVLAAKEEMSEDCMSLANVKKLIV